MLLRKKIIFISLIINLFFLSSISIAGVFSVSPIRLFFDKNSRTRSITIRNGGDDRLHLQIKAFEWSQDSEGKDDYRETSDIIFFPKMMVLEKKEKRLLRVGIKIPAVTQEKTYRLFIDELPKPKKAEGGKVRIGIKFGAPLFVAPFQEIIEGKIEGIELEQGILKIKIKNTGNVHFTIDSLSIRGKNNKGEVIFSKEQNGWYLLSSASRIMSETIPVALCRDITQFHVEVKTNRMNLTRHLEIANNAFCKP